MRSSTQELAIASIFGLLSVILVLVLVIFCLKRNRKQQTYKFRNAEDKEEINASKQTLSNWTVEIKNDSAMVKTGLIVDPSEDGSGLFKTRSQDHGSDFIPDSGKLQKLSKTKVFDTMKFRKKLTFLSIAQQSEALSATRISRQESLFQIT